MFSIVFNHQIRDSSLNNVIRINLCAQNEDWCYYLFKGRQTTKNNAQLFIKVSCSACAHTIRARLLNRGNIQNEYLYFAHRKVSIIKSDTYLMISQMCQKSIKKSAKNKDYFSTKFIFPSGLKVRC